MNISSDIKPRIPISSNRVLDRLIDRIGYASDASIYRLIPQLVVQPGSIADVQTLFQYSHEQQIPLTFRAAGTSLSGQAVTDGILVDLSKDWRQIRMEANGELVRLQPGVIGANANAFLRPFNRRIGPDPASIDACMLGGILANNASGMCCGVAENAYHTLHSMTVILPNGLVLDTAAKNARKTLFAGAPEIAYGLLDLHQRLVTNPTLAEQVRTRYKRKNTTGYSLNALLDFSDPVEILNHILIGSEGTLGFIAEAVLHTLPEYTYKYTGLLYFESIQKAADAIQPLAASGARALEIMDRSALRCVEGLPGAPVELAQLPPAAAALLVEYQAATSSKMEVFRRALAKTCSHLGTLTSPVFTDDPSQQIRLWKLRKGMYPAVGASRKLGNTVIIEDIAFAIPQLADAITDLQAMFLAHGYPEGIIFGHAKDGNLHFVITQSFNNEREIRRYDRFMADLVYLVTDKYKGTLKAEHSTGRNMAPFVEHEWGQDAYKIMCDLKAILDPTGLLNPGVIINSDPQAHIKNLKTLPVTGSEIDRCVECGFCEPKCPSRRLTFTPRQRIVVYRSIATDPDMRVLLGKDYEYAGLDTCALDGLCAVACPVQINTGDLVQKLRTLRISPRSQKSAVLISKHFKQAEKLFKSVIYLGHQMENVLGTRVIVAVTRIAEKITGLHLPKWNSAVPYPTRYIPFTLRNQAAFVYFPSCLTRVMGSPSSDLQAPSLIEVILAVSKRAGIQVWIPETASGHCCGKPFSSKGYDLAYRNMLHRTVSSFWEWSDHGRIPIVMDASSCALTLRTCSDSLLSEDRDRWQYLTILDPIEYAHDILMPRLNIHPLPINIILHPNCASRKLALQEKLLAVARHCALQAAIPQNLDCCGFAGDRGLLFPELTASAMSLEAAEVNAGIYDGFYSSNLTCEMGMTVSTGKSYQSIFYLMEMAAEEGN